MIEGACGKGAGSSKARNELLFALGKPFDDFFCGQTIDGNIRDMFTHFHEHPEESPVSGTSFWEASGMQPSGPSMADTYKQQVNAESL